MKEQMRRGVSQSLYRYLPESWIDFSVRGEERHNYIAKVLRWSGEPLEGVNKQRLFRAVNQAVAAFCGGRPEAAAGYGTGLTLENCTVRTPKHEGDERGIVAEISPLTFYCPKCHKVYQFKDSATYRRHRRCGADGYELRQFRHIYFCKCGWASDQHDIFCKTCKSRDHITWSGALGDYNFRCRKCGAFIPMRKTCGQCGAGCPPAIALDPSQYFSQTLSLIDTLDEKVEHFISGTDEGAVLTIACWLGLITREQLAEIIEKGISSDPEAYQKEYDKLYTLFRASGLDEENARTAAQAAAGNAFGSQYVQLAKDLKGRLCLSRETICQIAEMLFEYMSIQEQKERSTLEDAADIAQLLNTSADPARFREIAEKHAISSVQVCGEIPFIFCAYGYTRKEPGPEHGAVLHAFKEERNGVKNIYAAKLRTEGVLFEFDRVRILEWMLKNGYLEREFAPDLADSAAVKLWFANNIRPDLIKPFSAIDPSQGPTCCVYNLIHSLSHLLIKSAAGMCGLDKNSISEYILPGVPAVLIYCQNAQGFHLGALFNLFEAYFDKWIESAHASAQKCIFDPVCISRDKACAGCLYLNEVSCQHFNHDLDRSLVIGLIDRARNTRQWGFWEG